MDKGKIPLDDTGRRAELLGEPIEHIDIGRYDPRELVEAMGGMSFQARNLARAARIWAEMTADPDCTVILTIAGSLCSAGLRKVFHDLVEAGMVDVIVSSGANIVDQDLFEALGFHHYRGDPEADDEELARHGIDRIYDTYIRERDLRECDAAVAAIADAMEPGVHSSREFIEEMGRWLGQGGSRAEGSIIEAAYRRDVPIFVPAFSDCSAGFGLVDHQRRHPDAHVSIDSVRDFRQLADLVSGAKRTGIVVLGGGVPQNFVQDAVLAVEGTPRMHAYAVKVTVQDEHDGSLSGSTFREARSWGKVETAREQVVYAEATLVVPLMAAYVYHEHTSGDGER
jgi:deoxyhypusine synthase